MIYLLLAIAGIFGGFLAGLFGVGGGIIYVMVLPIALRNLGIDDSELAHYTIANSLLAIIFTSISALARHWKNKNIFPIQSFILGISGGITAVLITIFIVEGEFFSLGIFNWILLLLLIYMLFDLIRNGRKTSGNTEQKEKLSNYIPIGITGGIVAALSGLGGGVAVIPLIARFQRSEFRQIASISMGFIAISSLLVSLYNGFSGGNGQIANSVGYLIFPITLPLVAGVIVGAQFGVSLGGKISSNQTRIGFAILLGVMIIWKAFEILIYG